MAGTGAVNSLRLDGPCGIVGRLRQRSAEPQSGEGALGGGICYGAHASLAWLCSALRTKIPQQQPEDRTSPPFRPRLFLCEGLQSQAILKGNPRHSPALGGVQLFLGFPAELLHTRAVVRSRARAPRPAKQLSAVRQHLRTPRRRSLDSK